MVAAVVKRVALGQCSDLERFKDNEEDDELLIWLEFVAVEVAEVIFLEVRERERMDARCWWWLEVVPRFETEEPFGRSMFVSSLLLLIFESWKMFSD